MVLPLILSLLGSAGAGAGVGFLANMSPLVAGSLGAGLGTAIETGDLEKGLMAGLGGFMGGGLLGNLMGGASSSALSSATAGAATNPAAQALTQQAGQQGAQVGQQAVQQAAKPGLLGFFSGGGGGSGAGGMLNKMLPGGPGLTPVAPPPMPSPAAVAPGATAGAAPAGGGGILSGLRGSLQGANQGIMQGIKQGVMTGGGAGSAMFGGTMYPKMPKVDDGGGDTVGRHPGLKRKYAKKPKDWQSWKDGEWTYFDNSDLRSPRGMQEGGLVGSPNVEELLASGPPADAAPYRPPELNLPEWMYTMKDPERQFGDPYNPMRALEIQYGPPMDALRPNMPQLTPSAGDVAVASTVMEEKDKYGRPKKKGSAYASSPAPVRKYMAGGAIAGMPPVDLQGGGLADMPQDVFAMANEKDIIGNAIKALENQLPEEQAALALAAFVKTYGEQALRKLVSDIGRGKSPNRDQRGLVTGPGDGQDQIPARVQDTGEDVLLADGEFVVNAPAVAAMGGGDTQRGAATLDAMQKQAMMGGMR